MDENYGNSCEGETSEKKGEEKQDESKKTEDVADLILECKSSAARKAVEPTDSCRSSLYSPGPSFCVPTTESGDLESEQETDSDLSEAQTPRESKTDVWQRDQIVPNEIQQMQPRKNSIGPPPSYSFVIKEKRKSQKMNSPFQAPMDIVTDRPPPPAYAGIRGLYSPQPLGPPDTDESNRMCLLPSFAEPIWRAHSQPAFCPRCGILVLTTTHAHESVATHVAALALCLFGCWPCCFLPYCMNACKNTHHHCPVCQAYLGSYTPW